MTRRSPDMEVGLAFGSNLGDKAENIAESVRRLCEGGWVRDLVLSSLYRTAPWGPVAQDWFVNACAVARTHLAPLDLLSVCKRIEADMGRRTTVRWGPRLIDIDILYMGETALDTDQLTLPHAEMLKRAFVLVPLADLRPDLVVNGVALKSALARLDTAEVVRLATPA